MTSFLNGMEDIERKITESFKKLADAVDQVKFADGEASGGGNVDLASKALESLNNMLEAISEMEAIANEEAQGGGGNGGGGHGGNSSRIGGCGGGYNGDTGVNAEVGGGISNVGSMLNGETYGGYGGDDNSSEMEASGGRVRKMSK